MSYQETTSIAYETARARAADAPYGIGAAFVQSVGSNDLDGWQGSVAVSDGTDAKVQVLVAVYAKPGVYPRRAVVGERVAALVEQYAGRMPVENRLAELQAATVEDKGIRLDRWFPDLYDSIWA